jgi:hypothetical protein
MPAVAADSTRRNGKMSKPKGMKPGQITPNSGIYQAIGPRSGKGAEVTAVKGEPLPPTQEKGTTYNEVRPTKHKSGK